MNNYSKTRILTECAILIAMGTILAQLKIYEMPLGGSVTAASMVPFILISYRHGSKWGLMAGFANGVFQMLLGGLYPTPAGTAVAMGMEVILDYLLPFGVLGLAAVFAEAGGKNKLASYISGAVAVCVLRFTAHFLSGIIVWGSITEDGIGAVTYSLSYNGSYMLPEALITVAVTALLYKSVPKLFRV